MNNRKSKVLLIHALTSKIADLNLKFLNLPKE